MAIHIEQAEQVRHQQREEWSAAAPGWQARRDEVSQPALSMTERLLAFAGISTGQRVLDIACGNGDPSFTIAQRVAVSTWGPAERCPFFGIAVQIVMRHIELPPPDPGAPGPFALQTREVLTGLLEAAGFTNVEVSVFETSVMEAASPEAYWDLICETGGPLIPLLASLPVEARQALRNDAIKTYGELFPDGPVKLGGEYLVAAGTKA
jgi:hypothetical protein